MSDSVSEFWAAVANLHEESVHRDSNFNPRTAAEWDEYVSERAAIGEYERGMSRAEAEEAARIMAGPRPRRMR